MANPEVKIATSTADFTPDGLWGYRKGLSAALGFIGAVVLAISPFLPDDPTWTKWVGGVLAFCGAAGAFLAKNDIQPMQVVDPPLPPPAPQPEDFEDDEPGKHAADRPVVLGVIDPPQQPGVPPVD